MSTNLKVTIGQYSFAGRKDRNQDFHSVCVPDEPLLNSKGICIGLADGISTSSVSQNAAESAVRTFFDDYYCTSDAWSVRTSGEKVLTAANSWLHSQTRHSQYRYNMDQGYVCTFSGVVIKGRHAHVFHVGDARVYLLREGGAQQLTDDHRLRLGEETVYLSRALGAAATLEVDYRSITLEPGYHLMLATDGVHEHVSESDVVTTVEQCSHDLDQAAKAIVQRAFDNGSGDNLTVQLIRIDELPSQSTDDALASMLALPFPPHLSEGDSLDGFRIVREVYVSHRSYVYLAVDEESQEQVALKVPATDMRQDSAHLERFLMEEWIARRIRSSHVLQAASNKRSRNYAYVVTKYVEGQTLAQWMRDHRRLSLEQVRGIVEQIAKGLRAFHRQEMLHQDLRPENILIDRNGTAKIIDFGSVQVAAVAEMQRGDESLEILGTAQYTAPEYFVGEASSTCSDVFSLGVITYQMISGNLPYGAEVPKMRSRAALRRLAYRSLVEDAKQVPVWVDAAIRKAVHLEPHKRYQELSEFMYDLRHPNKAFMAKERPPLIERNPVAFWKTLSLLLAIAVLVLLLRSK